ncbi:MAG: methionine--tRNA ligase [Patescibacteria group bacterium]|jgi:methionyl-tRNA synthetase
MNKKFYITTPIYYVNDKPHIGHAYTTIAADVLARYHRLRGEEVFFLTGTDEHGTKVAQAAEKAGLSPQAFADQKAAQFQLAWDSLNISNNDFIRTTEKRHYDSVRIFLNQLYEGKTPKFNPAIYRGEYEGLYCVGCESYKTESDLVDGKCPDHGTAPQLVKEKNWFFRLSDFGAEIEKRIKKGEVVIAPEARKNEVLGLIKQGLKDVAMSRNLAWGVSLPFAEKEVAWVWFDALPNYLSALGYPDGENFKKFWPADVQLMAKDILKFHTVIWLGMLIALDLPLPKTVFAHGFFTIDGQKMSKTLGNVIDPVEMVALYGADAAKFFLLSEIAFGSDGDVSVAKFKDRYNAFLANGLGNVVARVLTLVEKYHENIKTLKHKNAEKLVKEVWQNYDKAMGELQFDRALSEIWRLLAWCDSYIEENKPWELAKSDPQKLGEVLYVLAEIIRQVGWLLLPLLPETAEKILTALGVFTTEKGEDFSKLKKWGRLKDFSKVKKPETLFPRKQ